MAEKKGRQHTPYQRTLDDVEPGRALINASTCHNGGENHTGQRRGASRDHLTPGRLFKDEAKENWRHRPMNGLERRVLLA